MLLGRVELCQGGIVSGCDTESYLLAPLIHSKLNFLICVVFDLLVITSLGRVDIGGRAGSSSVANKSVLS